MVKGGKFRDEIMTFKAERAGHSNVAMLS